jgi:hypothetical protein
VGRPHPVGEAGVRITVGGVALGGGLATLPQTGRHRAVRAFEEPGALDEVARLAAAWFVIYLG